MKRVFIFAFMYAPKQNGKTGGNQQSAPKTENANGQNETGSNDGSEGEKGGEGEKQEAEPVKDAEPTSEKLDAIRAAIDDLLTKVTVETDRKKKLELIGELQKTQAEETTEINAIKKAILDAQIAEKRNAKIALIDLYLAAFMAEQSFFNGEYKAAGEGLAPDQPNPLLEQMNVMTDATKQARENVENALLGTVKAPTSNGIGGGTKGETAKAIIASYEKYIAAGQDDTTARKSVIAEGFSRGTTGAVVLEYRKEKGLA